MRELLSLHESGVFLRREAIDFGYDDRALAAAVRAGVLAKPRRGAYADAKKWAAASPEEKHALRASAVLLTHGHNVALSHTSGAVLHELRLWRPDLTKVHVTRLDGGPGLTTHDVVYHEGSWTPDDVFLIGEDLVLSPVRCGFESASLQGVEGGLVTLDSLLDLDLATPDELEATFRLMTHWPRTQHVRIAFKLAQPGAQSVGESRGRFLCWQQHLPKPELQYPVYDSQGTLIGITDYAWPDRRCYGEFDGKIKYGRLLKPNQEPGDAVFLEKQREDLIRDATGGFMVRLIWSDLDKPVTTGARIRAQLARGARSQAS